MMTTLDPGLAEVEFADQPMLDFFLDHAGDGTWIVVSLSLIPTIVILYLMWVLLMAIFVHGGIALFLGMPTFGLVMLIGNLAFVSPKTVRKVFDPLARRLSLAVVGKATKAGGAE